MTKEKKKARKARKEAERLTQIKEAKRVEAKRRKAEKKAAKTKKKEKKQSNKLDRKYDSSIGAEFPIYVFNNKKKRTVTIKTEESLNYMGLHLGTILTCVRDGTSCRDHYFSYNKSIN